MAFLHAADLTADAWLELVRGIPLAGDEVLMAFSPAEARLEVFTLDESFLERTDQGRIFSPQGELKWRRVNGMVRAVYLGESPPAGLEDRSPLLEGLSPTLEERFLWGVRHDLDKEWIELEACHRFRYPVTTEEHSRGRLALVTELWEDSAGVPRFGRYRALKEVPGEKS